jgi:ATP-dependent DNA helicase RecQ
MNLDSAIEELGHPTILALTATAGAQVRGDIVARLGMRDPRVFVHGFDRPNISLRVDYFHTEAEKLDSLSRRVQFADKPGIVYVATRKNAEVIARALNDAGITAVSYHAGLKAREREALQEGFMQGDADVMVATNAFGMGVDKPDVRFVYHFDISDSLDSYYQEIGRAGRDGNPAEAVLFYRTQNLNLRKFQAGGGRLHAADIERVATVIEAKTAPLNPTDIADEIDISASKVVSMINRLKDIGALTFDDGGDVQFAPGIDPTEAAREASAAQNQLKERERVRIHVMQQYAELSTCRREFLLRYFGDDYQGPCRNCDNDAQPPDASASELVAGTRREVFRE